MKTQAVFSLLFLSLQICLGQNLLINPGAEADPFSSGWTSVVTGTSCNTGSNWRIEGGVTTYPASQSGTYLFYSGCGSISGEIYQDVDVSGFTVPIDAGTQGFDFTGYTHSFDQSPTDGARIIVEYTNASATVLESYDTGFTTNTSGWTLNSDSRNAPVGTRTIRVRMLSEANNGSSVDGYFDNLSLTASPAFPIDLLYFRAKITEQQLVELSWKTAQEDNNDFFTVERTVDQTEWEAIEVVEGAGVSSDESIYRATDKHPYWERALSYRLKQTDFDGHFSYSEVVAVNMPDVRENEAYIFPNPARELVTIVANQHELSTLNLFSFQGKKVLDFVLHSDSNRSACVIDVTTLPPGFYVIRTRTHTFKFYKQ